MALPASIACIQRSLQLDKGQEKVFTSWWEYVVQGANTSLYILLHGLAGRVPDAVATYCTLIRHMIGSMPTTNDPLPALRAMYPFAPSHSLASIASSVTGKQLTPDQVKQGLSQVLVSNAFSGEDLRHRRFCEVNLNMCLRTFAQYVNWPSHHVTQLVICAPLCCFKQVMRCVCNC